MKILFIVLLSFLHIGALAQQRQFSPYVAPFDTRLYQQSLQFSQQRYDANIREIKSRLADIDIRIGKMYREETYAEQAIKLNGSLHDFVAKINKQKLDWSKNEVYHWADNFLTDCHKYLSFYGY